MPKKESSRGGIYLGPGPEQLVLRAHGRPRRAFAERCDVDFCALREVARTLQQTSYFESANCTRMAASTASMSAFDNSPTRVLSRTLSAVMS